MANQAPTFPLFQVIRKGPRPNKSIRFATNLAAQLAGIAFIESSTPNKDQDDSGGCALADGTRSFAGFVTRPVLAQVGGLPAVPVPTYSELSTGGNPNIPFEEAFSAGLEGSLEDADEYEAEGSTFLATNSANGSNTNNDLTAATTVGTKCSFLGGKTCKATTAQVAEFEVAEVQTPNTAGNLRMRFRRIYGVII